MLITDKKALEKYQTPHRVWQGIPGIAHTKGGRTFVSFYSGHISETYGNFAAVIMSEDENNFSEPVAAAFKDGAYRCFDSGLWIDPLGRLWFFWNVMPGEEVFAAVCDDPDADELIWNEEFYIGRGVMMNKPTVLSTGEWLFPIAVWSPELMHDYRKRGIIAGEPSAAFVYKTTDNGKTFTRLGGITYPTRSFDEHMIYELNNGVLKMLIRVQEGIGESYSYDRGKSWSKGQKMAMKAPPSRNFVAKLKSGRVLLISHPDIDDRYNLTAMLSEDDGKTFPYRLLIDERKNVSYPDAMECDDGYIRIVYDRERGSYKKSMEEAYACAREILTAKITEDDIISGTFHEGSFTKNSISKLGKLSEEHGDPYTQQSIPPRTYAQALIDDGEEDPIGKIFEAYPFDCTKSVDFNSAKLDSLIVKFEGSGRKNIDVLEKIVTFIRTCQEEEPTDYPIIERIKNQVESHLSEEFSLPGLAAEMNISVHYMSHLFKAVTGTTVVEFRNELKLTKAKEALINTDYSISEIAKKLGFCSSAYFSEIFFKSEQISPSEYRKYHKAK